MTYPIRLVLPDEVMENLPADRTQWVPYLADFLSKNVLKTYENSLRHRQNGSVLGQELSRYERTMLLDFLIDIALGQIRDLVDGKSLRTTAEFGLDRTA